MSYYKYYLRKLVGGSLKPKNSTSIQKQKIKPGQVISFFYSSDDPKNKRKYMRLVFVLNTYRGTGKTLVHGLTLEFIPWTVFKDFIKRILIKDTLGLLKNRYKLVSPVNELVNRPRSFYKTHIQKLSKYNCYRTYEATQMTRIRVTYLDFKTLYSNYNKKELLLDKGDSLADLVNEKRILENELGQKLETIKLKDFNNIIYNRFGSFRQFIEEFKNIKDTDGNDNGVLV